MAPERTSPLPRPSHRGAPDDGRVPRDGRVPPDDRAVRVQLGPGGVCRATTTLALPADQAWELLTDVHRHADWVPLTRIDAPPSLGVGDAFVAVTGPLARHGAPGLSDRMVVVRYDPPARPGGAHPGADDGVARFVKSGPVLDGWAEIRVRPTAAGGTAVAWTERIAVRGVPGALTDRLSAVLTARMLALVLGRVHAEIADGA